MPRLDPTLQSSIFFLFGKNPMTGDVEGPLGSGVLIGVHETDARHHHGPPRHVYAVTCWHAAIRDGASIIRINTKNRSSRFIELEPHEWQFTKDGHDIAAIDLTDRLDLNDEVSCVADHLFATKEFLQHDHVGIGEDGFMLGLFVDQPGVRRNMVAARFGNISLLADDDAPLEQPNKTKRPSHIFDMRSRPGFSGSPVFIYRTPAADLRRASERGNDKAFRRFSRRNSIIDVGAGGDFSHFVDNTSHYDFIDEMETRDNTFLTLLGIHVGQYHDRVKATKTKKIRSESSIVEGDELDVPNSMALIVPAWEIANLLNLDIFRQQREERETADKKMGERENPTRAESK
jgi:hypothetical protein